MPENGERGQDCHIWCFTDDTFLQVTHFTPAVLYAMNEQLLYRLGTFPVVTDRVVHASKVTCSLGKGVALGSTWQNGNLSAKALSDPVKYVFMRIILL